MFPTVLSLITTIFWLLSKPDLASITTSPLLSLSQIASLIGTILLSLTFVLSSRFNFLEKTFGSLDIVYKKHHLYGAISFLLLISHPLFLAQKALQSSLPATIYLLPSSNIIYSAGILALYSLIVFLLFTLLIKLPYHLWFITHQLMGVVLFFAFIHTNFITSDVSRFPLLKIWILVWIFLATASYIYKKFLYTTFGPKLIYQVQKNKNTNGLLSLELSPVGKSLNHHPGQFVFVSFKQPGINPEFHPFSIASSPGASNLRLYIKIFGDYTGSLTDLKPGTKAFVFGPYGQLYKHFESQKNLVLVGGGIGITPFISMIENELSQPKNRQINLFYSNRNPESAFYHSRFQKIIGKNQHLTYHPIFTDSEPRLTAKNIQNQVPNFHESAFLLCGPHAMMADLKNQLISLKINPNNIYYEDFSLN